jgi:hypothetical protein
MTDDQLTEAMHHAEELKRLLSQSHSGGDQLKQARRQNRRTLAHLEMEARLRKEKAA